MALLKFLSAKQQLIILQCYNNGHKIDYKHQDSYNNEKSFERAMTELCNRKFFKKVDDGFYPHYLLEGKSKMSVRLKIIPLIG